MVELPEAAVLAEQINGTLVGKKIMNATANHTPHAFAWYTGEPADYHRLLTGKTILGAAAYGGHVEIKADDMALVISTAIRYHPENEKLPQKHQLLLEFEDSTAASCTVQMWGVLFCFKAGDRGGLPDYHLAKEKPSPLSGGFDGEYFDGLFGENTEKLAAKAFLATEQRIPGLGNGVLQDILYRARIHPKKKVSAFSAADREALYGSIRSTLSEMTVQGGRDTERDLFGCPGGYKTILSKNTAGKPCPTCGSTIVKEAYMGGSIYFCGGCQTK